MKNRIPIGNYLFKPFRYIAGMRSLVAGLILLFILSLLGYYTHTFFDGVLDVHYGCLTAPNFYLTHVLCLFFSWISATFILYIAARIFSVSSVRLIDMAGTLALAKWPLIFLALCGFIPSVHFCFADSDMESMMQLMQDNWVWMLLIGIVSILFSIWTIALMYNAFSVSGNLKGSKGIIVFVVGLLISEALSKMLIYLVSI